MTSLEPNIPYSTAIAMMQYDLQCTRPEAQFYYHIAFQFDELNFDDYRVKAEITMLCLQVATHLNDAMDQRLAGLEDDTG